MSAINQHQMQKLMQKLSPQQIQMIKLLELPAMQLEQRIKQELEDNPILEEVEDTEKEQQNVSVEEYIKEDDIPSYKYNINNYSKDEQQRPIFITGGVSFWEYLIEQLNFKELDSKTLILAKYLVGSIDDDGYLRRPLESLVDDIAFSLGIQTDEHELETALKAIHDLEPIGVGARTLQECLLLQLDSKSQNTTSLKLAKKILANYFEEFTKKHYQKLMSRLDVTEMELCDAIDEIIHLSPKPAALYNSDAQDITPHITPDFLLDYSGGEFSLALNYSNVPDVKINNRYIKMISEASAGCGQSAQEREAMQFVKHKIDSAKWFISAIKQRQNTLMQTMKTIFDIQREFFIDGDKARLKPMILKDVADRTGLDVSTISRVVNSKYIQTHFGIFLLKDLFSEAMQTDDGEEVSSYEIKKILSEFVDSEDKRKPMTDEALMEILNDKGYQIARRTVAKYREMLGIPVARLRKQL